MHVGLLLQSELANWHQCMKELRRSSGSIWEEDLRQLLKTSPLLRKKSTAKPIEHQIWQLSPNIACMGSDLFATTWSTIAGILFRMAASAKQDVIEGSNCSASWNFVTNYFSFSDFLPHTPTSPFTPSLKKAGVDDDQWRPKLAWPFFKSHATLKALALEAKKLSADLNKLFSADTSKAFDDKIKMELEKGDGWLHKWVRNQAQPSATICSDLLITGLQQNYTVDDVEKHFSFFGAIVNTKQVAFDLAIFNCFLHDEARAKALKEHGSDILGMKVFVTGNGSQYTIDPNAILGIHVDVWSGHWGVGQSELYEQTVASIKKVYSQVDRSNPIARRKFSPEQIRMVANTFEGTTATGCDGWRFTEISIMPDVVLQELAELLADMQYHATPPLQVMTNIMTMLPKKDGGTRMVAIAATLYRLLMELDNDEVAEFEKPEAFENDSATAGASAVRVAEDRALEAELAELEGSSLLTILWDL